MTDKEPQEQAQEGCADDEFRKAISEYLRAGYQCLFVPTTEEARLENELRNIAKRTNRAFITWDGAEGFNAPEAAMGNKYMDVAEALRAVGIDDDDKSKTRKPGELKGPFKGNGIFMFKDLPDFFQSPLVRRLIRSLCEGNKLVNQRHKRPIIISCPSDMIHDNLKPCITVVDFKLPNETMLRKVLDFVQVSIENPSTHGKGAKFDEVLADRIVACLRGLTSAEAENTLSRCLVQHKGFSEAVLETIKEEKAQIVKKSEVLTYIPETAQASRAEIGGFDRLFDFLERRRLAYGREARKINLDYPKGVVLLGVPGTGKSYVAMAMGKLLGLPVYIMDVGSVFGHLVGQSESRMRSALKQVEAQQGCVLLLDEADKAFGGAADASQDSGVTKRVFGQFLTWLANKKDRTFVVMTLNRTKGIPPELLRAGRFDSVFYTDLPHDDERRQILEIHLRKRGVEPKSLDLDVGQWNKLVADTQGFVGSELEELIKEARYIAFENRGTGVPNFEELLKSKDGIRPISILDEENVRAIQTFCEGRANPVTSPPKRRQAREQARTRAIDIQNN